MLHENKAKFKTKSKCIIFDSCTSGISNLSIYKVWVYLKNGRINMKTFTIDFMLSLSLHTTSISN